MTEDEIREAFIRVVNKLITDRREILKELRSVRDTLTGTEELEKERKRLAEQMNVDADAVQEIIAENARVAQNQDEYNDRYNDFYLCASFVTNRMLLWFQLKGQNTRNKKQRSIRDWQPL